jgi:hypothetical protein
MFPYLMVGRQPGKKPRMLSPVLAEAWAGRCAMGCTPSSVPWAVQHCASRPPRTVLMGRVEIGTLPLFCFLKFYELVQIIANFNFFHMIHLTLKNYETNFVR